MACCYKIYLPLLYTCTPVHLYTCTSVHLYICKPVHLYTCTPVHLYTCTPVHLYICTPVHLYTCTPVHLYTCTPVHLYTCTPVHICTCSSMYRKCGSRAGLQKPETGAPLGTLNQSILHLLHTGTCLHFILRIPRSLFVSLRHFFIFLLNLIPLMAGSISLV